VTGQERREILANMIEPGRIQFSEPLPGDAKAIFHLLDKVGLEGMVSKRRDSKYLSGLSTNWAEGKTVDEYELLGVEPEARKPASREARLCINGRSQDRPLCRLGLHQFQRGHPRATVAARPGARRARAEGDETAGDAMGLAAIIGRVKHLRGEEDLRHASLQDFRVEDRANPTKGG